MSVLNKTISYYPSKNAPHKGIEVNLLRLLKSNKHKAIIEQLRNEPRASVQKVLKETLPCYTVAGIFNGRTAGGLVKSSGLAAIDLDSAEDYNVIHLLTEIKKIDCIAYAGLSCRGKRLFCIIPFLYQDKYIQHYERLIKSFDDMGLPMGDSCHKQISQPRFVSYNDDNTCFYNHNAKAYGLLPTVKTYHYIIPNKKTFAKTPDNTFQWCAEQINKSHSFVEGQRHNYIKCLARYCNIKGLPEADTLKGCLVYQSDNFNEVEIKSIIKYIYINHLNSHNKTPFILIEKK